MEYSVLDILSDGILIYDENNIITYANASCFDYLGFAKDELIGYSFFDLYEKETRKELVNVLNYCMHFALIRKTKIFHVNKRILSLKLKSINNKEESLKSIVVMINDVTTKINREQSHDNLFRMYSIIFNSTQLAIVTIDKDGIVTSFNSAAERLFCKQKSEVLHKDIIETIFCGSITDKNGNYSSPLIEALETGKEYQNLKKEYGCSGDKVTVLLDTCILRNPAGLVLGVLGIFKDITDFSHNEDLAFRKQKYATMAQMAAGLADEMRNPLTSVKGFMQLIHERMRNNRKKEYVELALDELKRMERLIRNFLLFSSPDAPVMKLGSINRLIFDTIAEYKANLHGLDIKLVTPVEEFFMCLDEEQVKQAIINLLQNAVEAISNEGGKVEIKMSYSEIDPYVTITISDNGCGIEKEFWSRVYEPFFTTKEYNSGLGLTISSRIIEAHGGNITGYSNSSGGVTINISLPFGAYVPKKFT